MVGLTFPDAQEHLLTFRSVSPSVYVIFPLIAATNDSDLVGNAYTSWTLGVPEHKISN